MSRPNRKAKAQRRQGQRELCLREKLEELLRLVPGELGVEALRELGLEPEGLDNATAVTAVLVNRALGGDVRAYRELRDMLGETGSGRQDEDGPVQIIDDL